MHKPSLEGQKTSVIKEGGLVEGFLQTSGGGEGRKMKAIALAEELTEDSSDDDFGPGRGGLYEVGESSDAAAVTSETTWSDVVSLEVTISPMALMLDRLVIMRPAHGWEHLQDLFHLPAGDTRGRCWLFDELCREWEMHIEVGVQAVTLVFEEGFMRRCANVGDKLWFYQAVPPLHKMVFFTFERARKWKCPCSSWCSNVKVVGA